MKKPKKAAAAAETSTAIRAIKGFDKDLRCRGFQFADGETYTHEGDVKACRAGFHAISGHPLDAALRPIYGREAIAVATQCGNFGDYRPEELTKDYGLPKFEMMHAIISDLRSSFGVNDNG